MWGDIYLSELGENFKDPRIKIKKLHTLEILELIIHF
jgi:hypothetical protein